MRGREGERERGREGERERGREGEWESRMGGRLQSRGVLIARVCDAQAATRSVATLRGPPPLRLGMIWSGRGFVLGQRLRTRREYGYIGAGEDGGRGGGSM
jgi:hypothetical protein